MQKIFLALILAFTTLCSAGISTSAYNDNGVLYNLTSDMIFRFNGGSWYSTQYNAVNVTAFMSSTETTLLEIRYMPTDTMSCSAIRTVTLPILSE